MIFFQNPERAAVADLGWKARIKEFDLEGTAVFMPAIICLLLALQWGGTKYPWGSGRIIALLVLFGILIAIFIGIQFWKQDSATVPPKIMKQRTMWAASWFSFCLGAAFLLLLYYLPLVSTADMSLCFCESDRKNSGSKLLKALRPSNLVS
jgi:hypothetical protein